MIKIILLTRAWKAIYLVMLNLCTYSKLLIFKSNIFIYLGWLPPALIMVINTVILYIKFEIEPYRKIENAKSKSNLSKCFFHNWIINFLSNINNFCWSLNSKRFDGIGLTMTFSLVVVCANCVLFMVTIIQVFKMRSTPLARRGSNKKGLSR